MAILFLCCGHEKNWRWVALGGEAGETHLGQTPVRRKPLQPQQPDRGHSADTSVPKLTPSRATRPRAYCWTLPRVCAALLRWWLTGTLSFFFTFYFVLGYSQLTTLWLFQVKSKGTQPYTYMDPLCPRPPSHPGCHLTLSRVPCAIQEVLSVIHF